MHPLLDACFRLAFPRLVFVPVYTFPHGGGCHLFIYFGENIRVPLQHEREITLETPVPRVRGRFSLLFVVLEVVFCAGTF